MIVIKLCTTGLALLTFCSFAIADAPGRPAGAPPPVTSFLPGDDVDDSMGAPTTPGPLTAVGDITKSSVPNVVFYDFGRINSAQTEPVQHTFKLSNTSYTMVTIDHVAPGCDCTTAWIDNSDKNIRIAPGRNVSINISIDPSKLYIGKINKIVWVFLSGQSTPAFTIHMTGSVAPLASFNPSTLDFGTTKAGTVVKRTLSITVDSSIYGKNPPDPFSLNGDVNIKRDGSAQVIIGSQIMRTYVVTWQPLGEVGEVDDMIAMPQNNGSGKPGVSVMVCGIVNGSTTPLLVTIKPPLK